MSIRSIYVGASLVAQEGAVLSVDEHWWGVSSGPGIILSPAALSVWQSGRQSVCTSTSNNLIFGDGGQKTTIM